MPFEWWRWKLARECGWTLDYIDSLPLADIHEYWQVADGEGKAAKEASKPRPSRGRKR